MVPAVAIALSGSLQGADFRLDFFFSGKSNIPYLPQTASPPCPPVLTFENRLRTIIFESLAGRYRRNFEDLVRASRAFLRMGSAVHALSTSRWLGWRANYYILSRLTPRWVAL